MWLWGMSVVALTMRCLGMPCHHLVACGPTGAWWYWGGCQVWAIYPLRSPVKVGGTVFYLPWGSLMSNALLSFTSHVAGKNARVELFEDRVEWSRAGISGGKATAAVFTAGLSALATGLRNKDTEMIPLRSVSSVTSKKGMMNTTVSVITPGNTIDFRVSHGEAQSFKDQLLRLIR